MKKHLPLVFGRPQLKTCCLGYHFFFNSDQRASARIQADGSKVELWERKKTQIFWNKN